MTHGSHKTPDQRPDTVCTVQYTHTLATGLTTSPTARYTRACSFTQVRGGTTSTMANRPRTRKPKLQVALRCVDPSRDSDIAAILDIYSHHIEAEGDVTTFEEVVPTAEAMRERVQGVLDAGYPYIVAEVTHAPSDASAAPALAVGRVVGYHYVHLFRERAAYKDTVENSIYVHRDAVGCVPWSTQGAAGCCTD